MGPSRGRGFSTAVTKHVTVQAFNHPLELVPKCNHIVTNCTRLEGSDYGKETEGSNVQASYLHQMHGGMLVFCSACLQRSVFLVCMYADQVLLDLGSAHTFPYIVTASLRVHF